MFDHDLCEKYVARCTMQRIRYRKGLQATTNSFQELNFTGRRLAEMSLPNPNLFLRIKSHASIIWREFAAAVRGFHHWENEELQVYKTECFRNPLSCHILVTSYEPSPQPGYNNDNELQFVPKTLNSIYLDLHLMQFFTHGFFLICLQTQCKIYYLSS